MGKLTHDTQEDLPRSLSRDEVETKEPVFLATALPPAPPDGVPGNWDGACGFGGRVGGASRGLDSRAPASPPQAGHGQLPSQTGPRTAHRGQKQQHGQPQGVEFSKFTGEVRSRQERPLPGKLRGVALGMLFNGG